MKFEVIRERFLEDRTLGRLEIDGKFVCYTLEDKVRDAGVKVYGQTAIPAGTYKVTVEPFRGNKDKMYPYLHDVPMFKGICIHGGNKPEDSLGCILVAYTLKGTEIFGSAIKEVAEKFAANQPAEITIRNGGQQ